MVQENNCTLNYETEHLGTTYIHTPTSLPHTHIFISILKIYIVLENYPLSGLNSRQNSVLVVIIVICIIICIGLYFISVSNDYVDLQSFYYSFLERKSLICEGRMAHRQDLERMAPEQVSCDIERLHCCYCFVLPNKIFEGY